MKCAICRNGYIESGFTTVTLERNQTTLVFKQVQPIFVKIAARFIYVQKLIKLY